jgi:hypothetical protein
MRIDDSSTILGNCPGAVVKTPAVHLKTGGIPPVFSETKNELHSHIAFINRTTTPPWVV